MSDSSTKADADLQANLKRAQKATGEGPHFFALLAKGGGEGRLIVSRRKIPDKQVAEAKKALGGGTVVKGLCFGEAGQLVFETAKPPAPSWLVTVKKQAKEAGLSALNATFRQGRDDEAVPEPTAEPGEDGAPTAPPQPEAPPDAAAEWQRRVADVSARVKAAAAAKHPAARDLILGLSEAQTLFRRGDAGAAAARLTQVEAQLTPAPTAADPAAEFKARFAEWQGVIKQALTARPPNAGDMAKLLAQATALGKPGGDPVQALEKLKECHALAKAALAGGAPGAGQSKPTATAPRGPAGDGKPAPRRAISMVALQQSRLAWEATLKKVRAEGTKLTTAMVDHFKGHPAADDARRATERINAALGLFNEELMDVLDKALNAADADERGARHDEAAALINDYVNDLASDPVIAMLDANPFVPVAIQKTLSTTLKTLASKLA